MLQIREELFTYLTMEEYDTDTVCIDVTCNGSNNLSSNILNQVSDELTVRFIIQEVQNYLSMFLAVEVIHINNNYAKCIHSPQT